jgi:hypothetical protein
MSHQLRQQNRQRLADIDNEGIGTTNAQAAVKQQAQEDGAKPEQPEVEGEELPTTPDTIALERKGKVSPISPTSDKSIAESTESFNGAVNSALAFVNIANSLKSRIPPADNSPPTRQNYYLTDVMKELLRKRASEFSSFGVVPFDVLEDFLYVLVSIDNINDMKIISDVVGIPELNDERMIRNPSIILNLRDLFKIGYIANGLACLTKRFASQYQSVANAGDSSESKYAGLLSQDSSGNLSFSSLKDIISLGGNLTSSIGSLQSLTSTFGTGSVPNFVTQISNLPNVINSVLSSATSIEGILKNLMSDNIHQLLPQMKQITDIIAQAKLLTKMSENLKDVTLANEDPLVGDVQMQLAKISTKVTEVQSKLTEVMGVISSVKPPDGAGNIAQNLDDRDPGKFIGNFLSSIVMGQAIPSTIAANNPLLQSPSYAGKAFFGESGISLPAIDQLFNKRIAAFAESIQAAGTNSFSLQNFASFGGGQNLNTIISKMLTGSGNNVTSPNVSNIVNNAANILNVAENAIVEMRRSDNAIPLMISLSAAISNDKFTPFGIDVFANGYKLASSVANDVQKLDPKYLEAARTSL